MLFSHNNLYQNTVIIEGFAKDGFIDLALDKMIVLKTNDEFISDINQIKIIDNQILFVDKFINQQVYIFDQAIDSVKKIGRKGQGPGEYIYPTVANIFNDGFFIASSGTRRMEIYDKEGNYIKSIPIPIIGIMSDFIVNESAKSFYALCPTRYLKNSIIVFDSLGQKLNSFSKIDKEFSNCFDTFYPSSSFSLNKNGDIYQTFNHKYEIRVFNSQGNRIKTFQFNSPFYKSPDFEKAKNIHGASDEKKFRSTFTQIVGIYCLNTKLFTVILRNWNDNADYEDVLEFWNDKGIFFYRYKIEQGEELLAIDNNLLIFKRLSLTSVDSNPDIIIRKIQ